MLSKENERILTDFIENRKIDTDRYDMLCAVLTIPDGTCLIAHRRGAGPHWDVITRRTTSFHTFYDAADYVIRLCQIDPESNEQFAALREAVREHQKTGEPIVL